MCIGTIVTVTFPHCQALLFTYDNTLAGAEIVQWHHKTPGLPVHQAEGEGDRLLCEHAEDHPAQDDHLLVQPGLQLVEAHVTQGNGSAATRGFVGTPAVGPKVPQRIDSVHEAGQLLGLELALEVDEWADVLQVFHQVELLNPWAVPRRIQSLSPKKIC